MSAGVVRDPMAELAAGRERQQAQARSDLEQRLTTFAAGLLPACARSGWVPATSFAWLEELRERHDVVARRTLLPLDGVALVLVDLEAERDAFGGQDAERARLVRRAMGEGRPLPARPVLPVQAMRDRLDVAWRAVSARFDEVAAVAVEVSQAATSHGEELELAVREPARLTAGDPGRSAPYAAFASWLEVVAPHPSMELGRAVDHLRTGVVPILRAEFDPGWLPAGRVLPGAVW